MSQENLNMINLDHNSLTKIHENICHYFGEKVSEERLDPVQYLPLFQLPKKEFDLKSMCQLAARYFIRICQKEPFEKGNIRTALAASLSFLRSNQIYFKSSELDLFQTALETAHGEISVEEFSFFLLENVMCPYARPTWKAESL